METTITINKETNTLTLENSQVNTQTVYLDDIQSRIGQLTEQISSLKTELAGWLDALKQAQDAGIKTLAQIKADSEAAQTNAAQIAVKE